jgi:hypothetical protein
MTLHEIVMTTYYVLLVTCLGVMVWAAFGLLFGSED